MGKGVLQDTSEGATEKPRILGIHGGTFLTADVASSTDSHLSSTSVILRETVGLSSHLRACKTVKSVCTCGKWKWSRSVMSNSLQPMNCKPARLLRPWDFPGKDTGVGCHFLLQGIFPTQGLNLGLRHCRQTLYRLSHLGSLYTYGAATKWLYCIRYHVSTSVISFILNEV